MNLSTDTKTTRAAIWIIKNERVCFYIGLSFCALMLVGAMAWILGKDTEAVTFVLSLIMSFFFALPSIARDKTEARPIERMNFDEIMELVASSEKEEWKYIDEEDSEELFYLRDPKLRIVQNMGVAVLKMTILEIAGQTVSPTRRLTDIGMTYTTTAAYFIE